MNDIKVAIEPNIEPYLDGMVLEHDKYADGLVLLGNDSCC
jgi:hypothetical protein